MARFIDLVAIEGPDRGMRWSVEEGTYRVVARAGDDASTTSQLTHEGDRALEPAQAAYVDGLFAARAPSGERTRIKKRGADVVLTDTSVSRTHCLVFVDKGKASVADLMSTNGTKVNGGAIRDVDLKTSDVIHVGKTKLRVDAG
jgi:pSer/pThr/pTyr-binding forkhead associated (FHA) protein